MLGRILEKEPVYSRSATYKEVELNRRTYSDLREELVTKLVSLPPYNAIVHLAITERRTADANSHTQALNDQPGCRAKGASSAGRK